MEMKIELVQIAVTDVDKAKEFYAEKVGFHVDVDQNLGDKRFIQLTPPGSACSIAIGEGITRPENKPGTEEILLVVEDIQTAYEELSGRGVEISKPETMPWGAVHAEFTDPDGNHWGLQQKVKRD